MSGEGRAESPFDHIPVKDNSPHTPATYTICAFVQRFPTVKVVTCQMEMEYVFALLRIEGAVWIQVLIHILALYDFYEGSIGMNVYTYTCLCDWFYEGLGIGGQRQRQRHKMVL